MEEFSGSPVNFTAGALKQLSYLEKNRGQGSNQKLRIGVEGGGCAGLSYILQLDEPKEGDLEMRVGEIPYIMNKAHSLYLNGITIDFKEGLEARGFTFQNPNAQTTCGCGSSFGI
jgi:iron-sulfur cluster assembly protein